MTEEEKMEAASAICAVEVTAIRSEPFGSSIRTRATVKRVTANSQTIECFKGSENNEFDVIWPGGTLKIMDSKGKPISKIARIPGTPNLKVGQTALLYLWRKDPTDYFTILSWENGVNPIKWDERAKDFRLEFASPSGLPKRTRASRSKLASTQAPTLSEFKQKVRATLSRPQIRR